ncbi:hypothetical protein M3Y95_00920900 [Aphelenchoides besseyi]|nr:hypothetical protein M3Y95_00920900 [Aphelenchoides besseyi]
MLKIVSLLSVLVVFNFVSEVEGDCRDRVTTCWFARPYCRLRSLRSAIKDNCARSCGFCKPERSHKPKGKHPKKRSPSARIPKYKLHYFAMRFRAEPIRLAFHYKRVPFEDFRIESKDWPTLKKSKQLDKNYYPNGQVPALEIDGKMLMESHSIYRYVGTKFGLFGQSESERASLDSTAELHRELFDATASYLEFELGNPVAGNKDDIYKNKFVPALHKYLPQLTNKLLQSNSGFFGPSGVSWVDLYVAESILTFTNFAQAEMNKYPLMLAHRERVHSLPRIRSYVQSRPQTRI